MSKIIESPLVIAILAAVGMLLFIVIGRAALRWFTAAKAARAAKRAAKAAVSAVQKGGLR